MSLVALAALTAAPTASAAGTSCGTSAGNGTADEIVWSALFRNPQTNDTQSAVWTAPPDGSVPHVVLHTVNGSVNGAIETASIAGLTRSADGRQIAYACTTSVPYGPTQTDIYVARADGTGAHAVTTDHSSQSPSFSPDGRRIAFSSNRTGTMQIYTMKVDGSAQTNISNSAPYIDDGPIWGPAGLIAFTRGCNYGCLGGYLQVMSEDGSGQRRLAFQGAPSGWGRDGVTLLYTTGGDIWSVRTDTPPPPGGYPRSTQLTNTPNDGEYEARFSPDQTGIVFEGGAGVYRIPANASFPLTDTSQWIPVGANGQSSRPSWDYSLKLDGHAIGGCGASADTNDPSSCEGEPVNTLTGAYISHATDLALPGAGVTFALTRSYTSSDTLTGPLGTGWTYSLATSLDVLAGGDVLLRSWNGQQTFYLHNPDGSFTGDTGARSSLAATADGYALTTHDQRKLTFSSAGQLLSEVDPNGQGLSLSYSAGKLDHVSDAAGRVVNFSYYGDGTLDRVTLPDGRYVEYTYDPAGRLATVRDTRGGTTTYGYDAVGRLNDIQDQNQHTVVHNVYGASGRVEDQTNALGKHTTYTWDEPTQTSTMTDARGKQWQDVYAGAALIKRIDPLGDTIRYEYDADSNLTKLTDARNNATSMTYDARGNLLTRTAPAPFNYSETFTWNARNDVTTAVDGRGTQTNYGYDTSGNLTSVTDAVGTSVERTTTIGRDPQTGLPTSVTDGRGKTTSYGYDAADNLTSEQLQLGETTKMTYDGAGRITSIVDPRGNVGGANPDDYRTSFGYDDANHLTSVTDPLANVSSTSYDPAGNRTRVEDGNHHATTFEYDAANRLTKVTAADTTSVTIYAYDDVGNLTKRTDPKLHDTTYAYDDAGRLTSETRAAGTAVASTTSYGYDADGDVTKRTDGNGNATATAGDGETTYGWDELGRLKSISYSDSTPAVTFGYDENSNQVSMADGQGSQSYEYDRLDRLTKTTRGTDVFAYGYDAASNLTSRTYPDNTVTSYNYDDDERLQKATVGTQSTTYGYDAASNQTTKTLPAGNAYVETRSYDRAGRLTDVKNAKGTSVLSQFSYTLDPVGNPSKVVEAGATPQTTAYEYDALDRLTKSCPGATCTGVTPTIAYDYDAVGNRSKETRPSATTTYSYDAADELTQTQKGTTTTSYAYDHNGNETQAGTRTFAYDLENRTKSTTSGNATTTYAYAGDGRRLKASAGSTVTNYLWDEAFGLPQLALERNGSTPLRRYAYGSDRISESAGGADYYYLYDRLGSVANVTSASGATQLSYKYEPFGQATETAAKGQKPPANPMRFAGEQLDSDTGLYHLRARQYDPSTGRFTATDPLGAAAGSSYAYADGRPGVLVDPSGMFPSPGDILNNAVRTVAEIPTVIGNGDALRFLGQEGAGALNALMLGHASVLGVNAECLGAAGEIGGWLSLGVGGVEKLGVQGVGRLGTRMGAATYLDLARHYARTAAGIARDTYRRLGYRTPLRVPLETNQLYTYWQRHGAAAQEAVKWIIRRLSNM